MRPIRPVHFRPFPPLRAVAAVLTVVTVLAPGTPARAAREVGINVVVDLTPEGRKVAAPSPDKPAYYLPVMGGYIQRGAVVAGEPSPPPPSEVAHLLAKALAEQGYFVTNAKAPPSIVLSIFWGTLNPSIWNSDPGGDPSSRIFFNENEMVALVGGSTLDKLDLNLERENVMQGAEKNRYFVVVSAYDFNAYVESTKAASSEARGKGRQPQPGRKVLLWQAKMSVPSSGIYLDQVLPALISAGGPQFGKETLRPRTVIAPLREGRVEIGTPVVKGLANPDEASPTGTAPSSNHP